jgi:hypothetical protein
MANLLNIGATAMDKSKLIQLLNINWEMIEICKGLKDRKDCGVESRILSITDDLTQLVLELVASNNSPGNGMDLFALTEFAKVK